VALRIKDTSVVPNPDGWRYHVEGSNFNVTTKNYAILYREVVNHCKANGIPPPTEQEVINQMCEKLHVPCYDAESGAMMMNAFAMHIPLPPRLGSCCG
jgi:hypothetical protein